MVHIIKAITLDIESSNLESYYDDMSEQLGNLADDATVGDWAEILLHSENAQVLSQIAGSISVDFYSRMSNTITYANGNLSQLDNLVQGEEFNLLLELFAYYGFSASLKIYEPINELIVNQNVSSPAVITALDQTLTILLRPVLESSIYAFTCLGGFFLCISMLQLCRHGHDHSTDSDKRISHKVHIGARFIVAVALLLLTLLDLGHYYRSYLGGTAAPIYRFAGTSYFLPTIFVIALIPGFIDFILFLWRNGRTEDGTQFDDDGNEEDGEEQVNTEQDREKVTPATELSRPQAQLSTVDLT